MINYSKNKQGFTLIEMMVSLGVFSVVVTTAVGAFLVLISTNQRLQAEQSVMTNLAFAMDTMTREIRTGYNFVCVSTNNKQAAIAGFVGNPNSVKVFDGEQEDIGPRTRDCPNGVGNSKYHGLSFYEGGDSITGSGKKRILYYYDDSAGTGEIMRAVGNDAPQSIISSGVDIIKADFIVTGSETFVTDPADPDVEQPTVSIFIEAIEAGGDVATDKHYYLQTTVTQRILDL